MRVDLARLNHVLVPRTNEERERFRRSRAGRLLSPLMSLFWGSLTDEGRTLLVLTVLVGAFAVDVRYATAYVLFAVLAGVLAGSLVAARTLRLDGAVEVDAPERVTVGEPVAFRVRVVRRGADAPTPPVRVRGPFLPWDGRWLDAAPPAVIVPAGGAASATVRARFAARGLHHLDPFSAAVVTPLSLALGPRRASAPVKLHVVPRIAKVARLPPLIATRHQPGGVALASKSGESMDLAGVRPYRPGDPARDLHARSWARTGTPVVREYQQEYFTRVGVVLDTDTDDPERLEAAVEIAAGVVANLSRGEALVDVLVVGDTVHELTLGRSLGRLDQALDLLASVERGPPASAGAVLRRLSPYLERLSGLVVIALAEDEERRAVAGAAAQRGIACTSILVDEALARAARAGEELAF